MEPYDTIELGITRANGVRRQHTILADLEPDPELRQAHEDAAVDAEREAGRLYTMWNELLVKDMQNWENRANVTLGALKSANAMIKRSITELEDKVKTVGVIVKSIERIEALVALVAKVAAL